MHQVQLLNSAQTIITTTTTITTTATAQMCIWLLHLPHNITIELHLLVLAALEFGASPIRLIWFLSLLLGHFIIISLLIQFHLLRQWHLDPNSLLHNHRMIHLPPHLICFPHHLCLLYIFLVHDLQVVV